jgi:hypothetical protein
MMVDFFAGDLQELMKKLAYENWERRGRPIGSPEVDWLAAQKELASIFGERAERLPLSSVQLEPDEGACR